MNVDRQGMRAFKARLAKKIGKTGFDILCIAAITFFIAAATGFVLRIAHIPFLCIALGIAAVLPATWYRLELRELPPSGDNLTDRLDQDILARLPQTGDLTPLKTWQALRTHWQAIFYTNHLLLPSDVIAEHLADTPADMEHIWQAALFYAGHQQSKLVEVGHVAAAILYCSAGLRPVLQQAKISPEDIGHLVQWLGRALAVGRDEQPYFGGIGRDWANGYTPNLNQYGYNVSLAIERQGAHFGWLSTSPGVAAMKSAFSQGASAVALIGHNGVGKTSHVNALAQVLLSEQHDRHLEHRQIIALNPAVMLAHATRPGDMEHLILTLMNETAHAGHIILFFDDAELFFTSGVGSVDLTHVLLPIIQAHTVQMIFAMSPSDYQRLKANNTTFASMLSPIMLQEPPADQTLRILEDAALSLEHKHDVLISYEAIGEAYRLSGRYDQDTAYPGKALTLIEQSLSHADHGIVRASSVQQTIEQTRGVKVGTASGAEADQLVNLEARIHERMIGQSRAVSVVANALRRARAGVANPRRPIGSFLFLGPTGVGKTELAKAIAATFYGAEQNLIRLDMSEYQQPDDVQRLLSNGANESKSLILAVRQQPYSVILFDELEKAHPNILNLFLQLLDEGQLTDSTGRSVSFKDCIIIATSNAGANQIREAVASNQQLDQAFESQLTDQLIAAGQFKPEFLNRFDEMVLFTPLAKPELLQVVTLMLREINGTLTGQNVSVELTPAAAEKVVEAGYDVRLGARPLRRVLQRAVEDTVANRILTGQAGAGSHILLDTPDLNL